MAISFRDRDAAAYPAINPEARAKYDKMAQPHPKHVDQIAKRDKTVKKLETEIKAIAANPLGAKYQIGDRKGKPTGKVGRPSSGKVSVHMKLNPETVAAFRAHGPGWQALVSDILDAAAPK